jgi:hypothetical protein
MLLKDGKCKPIYGNRWTLVYGAFAVVVSVIIIYLISLAMRPVVNNDTLDKAEEFRQNVKLYDRSKSPEQLYPLDTNLTNTDLSGGAYCVTMLHFSWQRYVIFWAICVCCALYVLSHLPTYTDTESHPNHKDVFKTCATLDSTGFKHEVDRADWLYLCFTFGIYIFSTAGTFALLLRHLYVLEEAEKHCVQMPRRSHYVAHAKGFPICKGDRNLEEEYRNFFEKALKTDLAVRDTVRALADIGNVPANTLGEVLEFNAGGDAIISFDGHPQKQTIKKDDLHLVEAKYIVGVSVVWDMDNSSINFDRQVHHELDKMDREEDFVSLTGRNILSHRDSRTSNLSFGQMLSEDARLNKEKHPLPCDHRFDDLVLGRIGSAQQERPLSSFELKAKLEEMSSCGNCFVLFQTVAARNRSLKMTLDYDGRPITLKSAHHEPRSLSFANIAVREGKGARHRVLEFVGCLLLMIVCLGLWTILFYRPYAEYVLHWSKAPGMGEERYWSEYAQSTLLTFPIVLGNQAMYFVCQKLAERLRFAIKGKEECLYVVLYTVFVTFVTALDIAIVLQLAYGHHDQDSWKLAQASGVLGPKAVAQNPTIREVLFTEMVGYLYPMTLLVCYLLEPLLLGVLPFYIYKWIIRSRADIGVHEAEDALAPFPFDLTRYGDINVSVICVVLTCFIATPEVYIVFVYLLMMLLFVYCWDHYRVLRLAPRTWNDAPIVDIASTMLLSVPCALLAAAVVFRRYGAHNSELTRNSVPAACSVAFFAHLVIHLPSMWLIRNKFRAPKVLDQLLEEREHLMPRYEKVGSKYPFNHFNVNWVQCLRSKYLWRDGDDGPWCVPASLGRDHLLKHAPEVGCFFKVSDKKRSSFGSDFTYFKDKVKQGAESVLERVRSTTSREDSSSRDLSGRERSTLSSVQEKDLGEASSP